ncbi:embryo defective 1241, Chloroplast GrpE 1 [Hibiscus trionum]|uniref:GrpE protein homolog n=1 Tax=Hibiscus trionum TaxID=183268 RepID=A0A9W7GU94_HIBTR|nr:embryo defective 1241, Chloroplast GrpE 1 [Hibiscus trionum]
MATLLKTQPFKSPPHLTPRVTTSNSSKPFHVCFKQRLPRSSRPLRFSFTPSLRFVKLVPFAGETETTDTQKEVQEPQIQDSSDGAVAAEDDAAADESSDVEEISSSAISSLLQSYKEALASNDESKVADIEAYLKSVEDEKGDLEKKMTSLLEELSTEKVRVLRISADFDNFRKRTERERLSLVSNAQGEVLENLLSVLDNFERAKAQIKIETEGEEKINNSYQSIYKQFMEILSSLGVEPVDTVGNPFDPMLHEAIMREDSTEFEEGIILQEFRKGFKLGDRLLRPSMVKVSAGPGPSKPEQGELSEGTGVGVNTETNKTVESNETDESSETTETHQEAESS